MSCLSRLEKWFFENKRRWCWWRCLVTARSLWPALAEHYICYSIRLSFKHQQLFHRFIKFYFRFNTNHPSPWPVPDLSDCLNNDLSCCGWLSWWLNSESRCNYTLKQSTNLVGYSLMLYLIPTFLCMIPSRTMHLVALLLAALQRFTFLGRNFSSRVDSKEIIVYAVILVI